MGSPLILGDVSSVTDIPGDHQVAFAASGGLDSVTITHWLTHVHGRKVVALIGDVGQPDELSLDKAADRMRAAGAVAVHILPLRRQMAEAGLKGIWANCRYDGPYLQSTGIARHVIVNGIVQKLAELGIFFSANGSTGRGNDAWRFKRILNQLAPHVCCYTPWMDNAFLSLFRGREAMIRHCEQHGLPIQATLDAPYSTDSNLLGMTHEAGQLESLRCAPTIVVPGMSSWPHEVPTAEPEELEIRWVGGRPRLLNGKEVSLLDVFELLNAAGRRNGIGIVQQIENRINRQKGRGVYEQPAMEVLSQIYQVLLQTILDQEAWDVYNFSSRMIAKAIYAGQWFKLSASMCDRTLAEVAKHVTGTVRFALFRGQVMVLSMSDIPGTLYDADNVSMEAVGQFDHHHADGALRIDSLASRRAAEAGQIDSHRFDPKEVDA